MRYAFLQLQQIRLKAHALVFYYLFSDVISFGPKFGLRCIFSFTQLNKRRIFLLRRLVWLSSFYIRENVYELCFLFCKKQKVSFLNLFVSKKIYISYFFSVSKVINKILRFRRYIWCTFSFFIKGNAQFIQKVTFEPLIDFKQNHHKSCYF